VARRRKRKATLALSIPLLRPFINTTEACLEHKQYRSTILTYDKVVIFALQRLVYGREQSLQVPSTLQDPHLRTSNVSHVCGQNERRQCVVPEERNGKRFLTSNPRLAQRRRDCPTRDPSLSSIAVPSVVMGRREEERRIEPDGSLRIGTACRLRRKVCDCQ